MILNNDLMIFITIMKLVATILADPILNDCPSQCVCKHYDKFKLRIDCFKVNETNDYYEIPVLPQVTNVIIEGNLKSFPSNLCKDYENQIKVFIFKNTLLKKLTSLDCLTQLVHLDISNNAISAIPHIFITTLHQLRLLNLSNNLIEKIETYAFNVDNNKTALKQLDLSYNNISSAGFNQHLFEKLIFLENLNLSNNAIDMIPKIFNLPLKYVNFSFNHFVRIDSHLLVGLPMINLIELDFRNNKIQDLLYINPKEIKENFTSNRLRFDFSNNYLKHLDDSILKGIGVCTLSDFDKFFKTFLSKLIIKNNEIKCECSLLKNFMAFWQKLNYTKHEIQIYCSNSSISLIDTCKSKHEININSDYNACYADIEANKSKTMKTETKINTSTKKMIQQLTVKSISTNIGANKTSITNRIK